MASANKPTVQEVVSNDLNYETWAPIMKSTLVERGLWDVVENNVSPPNPLTIPELAATIQAEDLSRWRDFVVKDTKAIHILQCSLPESVFRQTLEAASAKDLWDLLQESNEQAKLQKDFEQLQIKFRERFSTYIDRLVKISTDPRFADMKSKFRATTKQLISLSNSYDGAVPVVDQLMAMQNLSFSRLLSLLDMFESLPVDTFDKLLKVVEVGSSSDCEAITKMFTSLSDSCDDDNLQTFNRLRKHLGVLESLPTDAICRMLKRQKEVGALSQSKQEVVLPEYQTLAVDIGPRTYDDDMWMIYTTTSNHMSPHEKYFTSLDRTHKARIKFITGKSIMSEGIGDVVMITDKGKKKMIKNVLFVPKINRNILSAGQLTEQGYEITMSAHKCTIKDQNGRLFGEAMWEERGFFLRLHEGKAEPEFFWPRS